MGNSIWDLISLLLLQAAKELIEAINELTSKSKVNETVFESPYSLNY